MPKPKHSPPPPPIPFPQPAGVPLALDSVDNTADPGWGVGPDGFPILPDPAVTTPANTPVGDEFNAECWRDWIIPARDRQGHKSELTMQVPPATAHQVSIAIASKQFPYRTQAELLRHALHRHLRFLAAYNGNMPSVMSQIDAMNALLVEDQLLQEQQEVLARMQTQVERHCSQGDVPSAKRLIGLALANIDSMPPGAWRDSYRRTFDKLFAWAVEAMPDRGTERKKKRGM